MAEDRAGRAYMKEAQLLILDEPTSALDARAEYEVFQRFAELTKGKTAVLISHRFSTVRMADRILVLDKGTLLETGNHDELLKRNGRYAELFHLQAKGTGKLAEMRCRCLLRMLYALLNSTALLKDKVPGLRSL